jgi:hypothetical protein
MTTLKDLSPDQIKDLVVLARFEEAQYALDKYTDKELLRIQQIVNKAKKQVTDYVKERGGKLTEWNDQRSREVLREMDRLTLGVQGQLADKIHAMAEQTFKEGISNYENILSFDGRVKGFNTIALSPTQLKSLVRDTPVGGRLLQQELKNGKKSWLNRTFNKELQQDIRGEIAAGMMRGKGYPELVKRLHQGFDNISKREAVTLARTYVQSANVRAMQEVYGDNFDIVKGVKWSAVMENGYSQTGRGTCIRCAALDGTIYKPGTNPPCPLHPRCRCLLLPVTKTYKELGLDIEEIKEAYRPYTLRQNKNIDAGGRRKILEVGRHQGNYASWFEGRDDKFKINVIGPKRFELMQQTDMKFQDLVDSKTGRLFTLKELQQKFEVKT